MNIINKSIDDNCKQKCVIILFKIYMDILKL